jgi:hypothetical protein
MWAGMVIRDRSGQSRTDAHPPTVGRADPPIPALIFAAALNARRILPIVG